MKQLQKLQGAYREYYSTIHCNLASLCEVFQVKGKDTRQSISREELRPVFGDNLI